MNGVTVAVVRALRRCAPFVLSIFCTYCVSSGVGMIMAHTGSSFALGRRDNIVNEAEANDPALRDLHAGRDFAAACEDCAGNIIHAALPQTVAGLGVVFPYFTVAYQGWVGGIVSVDGAHRSRFRDVRSGAYYLLVLLLQFIPFSLSIGAGVACGVEFYRFNAAVSWRLWNYRIPASAVKDLAIVCAVSVPLFLTASLVEFLA